MKLTANTAMRAAAAARPIVQPAQLRKKPKPPPLTPEEIRKAANKRTHDLLRTRWPAIFTWARPLKIGIDRDISAALGEEISRRQLRLFLAGWCRRPAYLKALEAGVPRVGLDGEVIIPSGAATIPGAAAVPVELLAAAAAVPADRRAAQPTGAARR